MKRMKLFVTFLALFVLYNQEVHSQCTNQFGAAIVRATGDWAVDGGSSANWQANEQLGLMQFDTSLCQLAKVVTGLKPSTKYKWKVTVNNGWSENYGCSGLNGPDCEMTTSGEGSIRFKFDPSRKSLSTDIPTGGETSTGGSSQTTPNPIVVTQGPVGTTQGTWTLNNNPSTVKDPATVNGRSVYVHLFEWKWNDIAAECERFLGPKGFGGVQISPPNEHALIDTPYRPWWQRYQPVSYKLQSRSGTEQEFKSMVERCNAAGVRIYVDVVINHMAAGGNKASAGSSYNPGQKNFPAVPFGPNDFNDKRCSTASGNIENYNDVNQVRNCKLVSLPDLATGDEYVRQKIADYLNALIDIGVAGYRVDASKHMWPGDCQVIFNKLKNLRADVFGANKRPFIFQEVIDLGGEPIKNTDYTGLGRVTEFKYGMFLSQVINKSNGQKLAFLKNFGAGWGFIADSDSVSFIDNHDNQRGHGGGGAILTFFEARKYKMANAYMLAWPYGFAQIMSSYNFNKNDDSQGPPTNGGGDTKDVLINADGTCGNGWICEHRWRPIANMVEFRNVANGQPVANWWDNAGNQIAFSRGSKAFIAINNENFAMDVSLQTGLPAGTYCDVNSGHKVNGQCTGRSVTVGGDGRARINIGFFEEDPVIAIHEQSKL